MRIVTNQFDPNTIRKSIAFNLGQKPIFLRNKCWNLVVDSRDHIGFVSYMRNEPFEMAVYNLVEQFAPSNRRLIVDIGANIGSASVPVCRKHGYELVAVEASKTNLPLLSTNILNNGLKAKIIPCALVESVTQEFLSLHINRGNTGANSLIKGWNPSVGEQEQAEAEHVPAKTLDQIIEDEQIKIETIVVTKIDVEGMEAAVLRGGIKFLTKNVAPVIFEYRLDAVKKYASSDLTEVLTLFEKFDYCIRGLTPDGGVTDFNPSQSYENVVAIKQGHELEKIV